MDNSTPNHYERAFEGWLAGHGIDYVAMDESKRAVSGETQVKTFDFLLYLRDGRIIIAEVKGRSFKGTSLENMTGLECWVTAEDIEGLTTWQRVFSEDHKGIFFFAYRMENVDVDYDGREVFEFEGGRYFFMAITLDDYVTYMKQRSPKWQTVTLSADKFRELAVPAEKLLL